MSMNLIKQLMPNQLVQNGNFESASGWNLTMPNVSTLSVANNELVLTATSASKAGIRRQLTFDTTSKYLLLCRAKTNSSLSNIYFGATIAGGDSTSFGTRSLLTSSYQVISSITTVDRVTQYTSLYVSTTNTLNANDTITINMVEAINLTELYGAGNEPSTVQAFKQDFPLDYYPYRATSGNELLTTNLGGALTCDLSQMLPSGVGCVDWQNITINYVANKQIFEVRTTDRLDNSTDLVSNLYVNSANALAEMPDMTMRGNAGAPYIYIKNTSYTDVQSFKQAMQGVPLLYKKA